MTFFAFLMMGVAKEGIPVGLVGLAMICDTILLAVAMKIGVFS